ncbi:DNA cytosine methyltransferase [Aquitalea pelogenes]|uniref:DNA cytosine methyltransferase n=1 Tax=Aquitalea pelogenes TaxID=1293573 RepID=UPI0035ADE2C5
MNELALFAGAGGGILGGHLLGWRTVCAVERDAYAAQVLAQRQNDGCLPPFPIWSDVCSFDGRPWRGLVDVVSGGFPCQDISAAGAGKGIHGERSGLWRQMARIISEVRPRFVFVENSPLLVGRGLAVVLGDLAQMGYDAQWGCVSASDCGAPHQRDRAWIVAHANGVREQQPAREQQISRMGTGKRSEAVADASDTWPGWREQFSCSNEKADMADTGCQHGQGQQPRFADQEIRSRPQQRQTGPCGYGCGRWPAEPDVGRVANGVANRMDRIKALGNGQVPKVAATAWQIFCQR